MINRSKTLLLSFTLSLAMVATLFVALPATAYAADWHVTDGNSTAPNGLAYALNNHAPGDVIILDNDVTIDDTQIGSGWVDVYTNLTIDLAGYNLTLDDVALYVDSSGSLNIINSGSTGGVLTLCDLDVIGILNFDVSSVVITDGSLYVDGPLARVSCKANLTALDSFAVYAGNESLVEIWGNITANNDEGLVAEGEAVVRIQGSVTSVTDVAVIASDSGTYVSIIGDIAANSYANGIYATWGAKVDVTGSVTAGRHAVEADLGAQVSVSDNLTGYMGVYAYGRAVVTVGGDITAQNAGVVAIDEAMVTVDGSVSVTGDDSAGAYAQDGASILIKGDILVSGTGVFGAGAYCSEPSTSGGTITVNGTITIPAGETYVYLYNDSTGLELLLDITGFTSPTTLAGYLTYTDGASTVWVSSTEPVDPTDSGDGPGGQPTTPPTGDSAATLLGAAALLSTIGALSLAARARRQRRANT